VGVAGDHRHLDPETVQLIDRLSRLGSDLVLHGEGSNDPAILEHIEDRGPPSFHPFAASSTSAGYVDSALGEQGRSTDGDAVPVDVASTPRPLIDLKPGGREPGLAPWPR
jgi:hypothetical protein